MEEVFEDKGNFVAVNRAEWRSTKLYYYFYVRPGLLGDDYAPITFAYRYHEHRNKQLEHDVSSHERRFFLDHDDYFLADHDRNASKVPDAEDVM